MMTALEQIVDEGVLGASRHVAIAHELLGHIARTDGDPARAWSSCRIAAEFVVETRGAGAPIVANAVTWLLEGLEILPAAARAAEITRRAARWRDEAATRLERLVDQAVARLAGAGRVIAYDYSGTVAAIVVALARGRPDLRVVVPESRSIAGGRRYLEAFSGMDVEIHFVLDAAFEHVLGDADAVLLGAESVRADGSLLNTIGSRPLARLARLLQVPVFGCADFFKLDLRSYAATMPPPELRDFDAVLLSGVAVPAGARVSTRLPELEIVPADLITAFLTEQGPVAPQDLSAIGRTVLPNAAGKV